MIMHILPQYTKYRGKMKWKSYGACPYFHLVVRGLPTLNRFTGSVRDTNEVAFVFTPPESYWFSRTVRVTQVTENPTQTDLN